MGASGKMYWKVCCRLWYFLDFWHFPGFWGFQGFCPGTTLFCSCSMTPLEENLWLSQKRAKKVSTFSNPSSFSDRFGLIKLENDGSYCSYSWISTKLRPLTSLWKGELVKDDHSSRAMKAEKSFRSCHASWSRFDKQHQWAKLGQMKYLLKTFHNSWYPPLVSQSENTF